MWLPLRLRVVVLLLVPGCAAAPARYEFAQIVMGGEARIVLYAEGAAAARAAAAAAFDRLDELEWVMSDYRPASEISRLGRTSDRAVTVSNDLHRVLERALAVAEASGGAFDPTVGPLVRLWRETRASGRLPADDARADALARTGWRLVRLGPDRTVTLARPGMALDLGGIGKGFAADAAVARLRTLGVDRCLVDLGGDVSAGAPPPGRRGWRVRVEPPAGGGPAPVLELARAAVATSGDAGRFVEIDGVRYSHIVDPRTGLGLTERTAVTVVGPDGATADALASAVSVLGAERGLALVARHPGTSALVATLARDRWRYVESPRFPRPAARAGP